MMRNQSLFALREFSQFSLLCWSQSQNPQSPGPELNPVSGVKHHHKTVNLGRSGYLFCKLWSELFMSDIVYFFPGCCLLTTFHISLWDSQVCPHVKAVFSLLSAVCKCTSFCHCFSVNLQQTQNKKLISVWGLRFECVWLQISVVCFCLCDDHMWRLSQLQPYTFHIQYPLLIIF